MRIPLFHVNAFTSEISQGNPAAVCLLDGWLDDDGLQKVAAENNLSATAFLVNQDNRRELRWFTPRCEIKLCGHATFATGFVLHQLHPNLQEIEFQTRYSGVLTVRISQGIVEMSLPTFTDLLPAVAPTTLLPALGVRLEPEDFFVVNGTYIVVYADEDAVREVRPDLRRLEEFHPFALAVTAPGRNSDFVARYFAPSYGIREDPVTGSLQSSLTPYWAKRVGKSRLHARQLSERGGELRCEMARNRVIISGDAVLRLQGTLTI